ncbi:hypothetical protein [Amaricoccus macauensis]|uniref:hypothetical protein n=1 Tax=Amaricoccus macauensis TaxID=57001 RepID=UPI003C7B3042
MNYKILTLVGLVVTFPNMSLAQMSKSDMEALSVAVVGVCRGGTNEGSYNSYDISANGSVTLFKLKGITDIGLDGSVQLDDGEWKGIKALVPIPFDQSAYNECVKTTFPYLVGQFNSQTDESIHPSQEISGCDISISGDGTVSGGKVGSNCKIN